MNGCVVVDTLHADWKYCAIASTFIASYERAHAYLTSARTITSDHMRGTLKGSIACPKCVTSPAGAYMLRRRMAVGVSTRS